MKNHEIKVMIERETKEKFVAKCKQANLSMTGFIEKIANEPVIFLDSNSKALIEAISPIFPKKYINKTE